MTNSIPLPPLPPIYENHAGKWIDVDQLRARDQEIVRCVLEAAVEVCVTAGNRAIHPEHRLEAHFCAAKLRALEFHHE